MTAIPTEAMIEAAQTALGHEAVYVGAATVQRALSAALSAGQAQPVVNWDDPKDPTVKLFVGYDVESYVEEYEFCGDEGDYTPNEAEKGLLIDAIYGVVADLHEKLRALSIAPAHPPVQVPVVKALEWKGPDSGGEYHSLRGLWGYIIRAGNGNGFWLTEVGGYFPTVEAAKAAAQSDYEARIRSALLPQPAVPGEVRAQLSLIKHLAEYTTEKNWADKRLYIMQAVDRALSALPGDAVAGGEQPATPAPSDRLRVTGFRGNPLRVVLSSGHEATVMQKLIDAFASPSPFEQHPDDLAVDRFTAAMAEKMKSKLAKKRGEGVTGWDNPEVCHIDYLVNLLVQQIHERAVLDPIDIANIAMMIHERGETPDYGR